MSGADETRSPSPAPGRSLDIELSGQEIITVDLDNLDANPEDLLDVLRESQSKPAVWSKLASEYWRKGYLDAAEKLATGGIECTCLACSSFAKCNTWCKRRFGEADDEGCYPSTRVHIDKHPSRTRS